MLLSAWKSALIRIDGCCWIWLVLVLSSINTAAAAAALTSTTRSTTCSAHALWRELFSRDWGEITEVFRLYSGTTPEEAAKLAMQRLMDSPTHRELVTVCTWLGRDRPSMRQAGLEPVQAIEEAFQSEFSLLKKKMESGAPPAPALHAPHGLGGMHHDMHRGSAHHHSHVQRWSRPPCALWRHLVRVLLRALHLLQAHCRRSYFLYKRCAGCYKRAATAAAAAAAVNDTVETLELTVHR